jgi:PAS domain S-box-containing protein
MNSQSYSLRSAASALLPVATAVLAVGVFIAEAVTAMKLAVAACYVIVVLLAGRFSSARGIVLVGAGCVGLTLLAFFLPGFSETEAGGVGIKASISAAVIGLTTFLVIERHRATDALREGETHWREVFEHNPVMYFIVSPTGTVLFVNRFGASQLDYTPAELIGQSVLTVFLEEDWQTVKDQLTTCAEELGGSHSWESRKVRKDGRVIWVRENAKAARRPGNDVIILIASEDITERRRGDQRVAAQFAVTRVLAEADSFAGAAPQVLRPIGENLEWDWGSLWSFDWERGRDAAPLRCDIVWGAPDLESAEFDTVSREWVFAGGEGLVGQVWRTGKPIWIVDLTTEPGFLRASAAAKAGLHGGVIFPILLDTEPLGVVEFFSRAVREPDAEQLATLSAIGSQIGQFIKRRRAEAALRVSEERWRRLFETSAAGMALARLDGVFTAANPALQRMFGRAEEEIVGHSILELNPEEERAATAEALAKFRSGSLTERQVEKKYLKKDGSPVWLNITTTVVPATGTAAPFLQVVYMDITERVQAEAALRASEERWRAIFDSAAVGIAAGDLRGGLFNVNPTFQRMLGYTEEELRNLCSFEFTHEDDRDETRRLFSRVVTGRQPSYRLEKRYRRKDGGTVWADVNASLVPATDNTPAFLAVMAVDITDRKRAEAALRASEERWRTVFETTAIGIATSDLNLRYATANQSFQRMTGYTGDELRNLNPADITHEDDRAATQQAVDDIVAGPRRSYRMEKRYRRKDGQIVWADVNVSFLPMMDGTPAFFSLMAVDISDRKRAEAALRASEERWRAMFETAPVGITMLDFERRAYLAANAAFQRMTGYTEDELRRLTALDVTHQDDRAAAQRRVDTGSIGGQQKRYRRRDGGVIWADISSFAVPATDSTPAFLGAVIVDITDRKRAEDALRRSEAYLNKVFETMPDGVAIIGRDYRYERVNPVYEDRTGLSCEQIVGMHIADINGVEAFNEVIKPQLDRCFAGEHVSYARWSTRFAPGERYHSITYAPLFVSESRRPDAVLAITRDLTEFMQASEALQQAQADLARLNRVMTLDEMAASIAHEVNQPIAAVITNANAGLRWLGAPRPDLDEVRQTLGRIVRDGSRAGEVIGRIRALVKKVPPRRDLLDINEAIGEVIALTQTEMQRTGVRLQSRLAQDLPLVSADRVQLQQIMINLIVNAIEAMAGASNGSRELKIESGIDDGNDVFVAVQDTGPGLDPEKLDRLFQSFYTTKPDGIGMGLAISRSIAEAHGGRLSAAPNRPRGAVFRFTLPVEEQSAAGAPNQPVASRY